MPPKTRGQAKREAQAESTEDVEKVEEPVVETPKKRGRPSKKAQEIPAEKVEKKDEDGAESTDEESLEEPAKKQRTETEEEKKPEDVATDTTETTAATTTTTAEPTTEEAKPERPKSATRVTFSSSSEAKGVESVDLNKVSIAMAGQRGDTVVTTTTNAATLNFAGKVTGAQASVGIFYKEDDRIDRILDDLRAVYNPEEDFFTGKFPLTVEDVRFLAQKAVQMFRKERMVVNVPAPCKVFGDFHGQFADLMRHMDKWKGPESDIDRMSYMFLGDYVDRGYNSLEVACFLLALKVKYERYDRIVLLRGNHELRSVNKRTDGLYPECVQRLGKKEGEMVWGLLNGVFEHLPLAGLISKKVLCFHGGISPKWEYVNDIDSHRKPLVEKTIEKDDVLYQLLWADPALADTVEGVHDNSRGPGVITFGADVVREFCVRNDLLYVIRGHEVVQDGFEVFARARMWTVFSATNYCYDSMNSGGMLLVTDKLTAIPHIIRPGVLKPPKEVASPTKEAPAEEVKEEEKFHPRPHSPVRGSKNISSAKVLLHESLVSEEEESASTSS